MIAELDAELLALSQRARRRRLRPAESPAGAQVTIDGRRLVNWGSNDYLGLASHPALAEAASRAAHETGVGARASRLMTGTTRWHTQLEEALAAWFGEDRALVYPSGYLANLGTLGALFGPEDALVLDRSAHASLVDAAHASRATVRVFRHNDAAHAAQLLARYPRARRRGVVTEGVFSMDGDRAPLAALAGAAEAHGALLYVDDAHGAFVLGAQGRGALEAAGVARDRAIYMATLGKALGAQGGFVVGPSVLIDLLVNRAKTFIYSTGLAAPVAAAGCAALEVLRATPALRDRLAARAAAVWDHLAPEGITPLSAPSHIVPVIIGEEAQAVAWSERLAAQGHWAPAIRPPTVRRGTARLRISVTAEHTPEMVAQLAGLLREAMLATRPA